MAALRLVLVVLVLAGFLVFGVPLQWLTVRLAPRLSSYLPLLFCRSLLALLRVEAEALGSLAVGQPLLLASNHVSWIDILVLGAIKPFCFLAKSDVASWPMLSVFADIQGTVFVDRRRKRSIPGANRRLAARMRDGRPVLLFPEGTTSAPPVPRCFLSSHFAAARDLLRSEPACASVAIQPVAVAYSSPAAAWVGDDTLAAHLWRTLKGPPLRCVVSFGDPVAYIGTSDRKQIALTMSRSVQSLLRSQSIATAAMLERPDGDILLTAAKIS